MGGSAIDVFLASNRSTYLTFVPRTAVVAGDECHFHHLSAACLFHLFLVMSVRKNPSITKTGRCFKRELWLAEMLGIGEGQFRLNGVHHKRVNQGPVA